MAHVTEWLMTGGFIATIGMLVALYVRVVPPLERLQAWMESHDRRDDDRFEAHAQTAVAQAHRLDVVDERVRTLEMRGVNHA